MNKDGLLTLIYSLTPTVLFTVPPDTGGDTHGSAQQAASTLTGVCSQTHVASEFDTPVKAI